MGLSRERVRQIEFKAMAALRDKGANSKSFVSL